MLGNPDPHEERLLLLVFQAAFCFKYPNVMAFLGPEDVALNNCTSQGAKQTMLLCTVAARVHRTFTCG